MVKISRHFKVISPGQISRPCLDVELKNPHTGKSVSILAIIDTGADECAMPAELAEIIEHNLKKGKRKPIRTGSGMTAAYSHTVSLIADGHEIKNVLIDFMPHLHVPLIGVKSFLANSVLTIDYPEKKFTILMN